MFLTQTVEMNKIKETMWKTYMQNDILKLKNSKNIIETRIKEENVGNGKDPHLLLIEPIVM